MLKFLRKNTKVVVWIVVIAFVGWGGFAARTQFEGANRSPGRVFGKEVSFREYLQAGQIVDTFYAKPKDSKEPISAEAVEAQTWQFLALSHEAKKRKINVSDDEVRQSIAMLLSGKDTLDVSPEQYSMWIRGQFHREPREFENQIRENLRVRKLLDSIRKGFPDKPEEGMKAWLMELIQKANPEIYRSRSV